VALVEQFKNGTLPAGVSDKELWEALKVKQVWWIYTYLSLGCARLVKTQWPLASGQGSLVV